MSNAPRLTRRRVLAAMTGAFALSSGLGRQTARASAPEVETETKTVTEAAVTPGVLLRFPADEGSHPAFRIEWWYVTGWLRTPAAVDLGFQVTFFRHRTPKSDDNPSRFATRQVFAAHAALSDPRRNVPTHVQRIRRAVFDRAAAREGAMDARIGDWSLAADGDNRIVARIADRALRLDLAFERMQPPLLHGDMGYSRKGPSPNAASEYYTLPHLAVSGNVAAEGLSSRVEGTAWLDHEWSSAYTDEGVAGWDWIGINLDDGGALMAFRMRASTDARRDAVSGDAAARGRDAPDARTPRDPRDAGTVWAGATHRDARGVTRSFGPADITWKPIRMWRSPLTGATYPVAWRVDVAGLVVHIEPLMDDQEQDTRLTTGTVYWEGAVTAHAGSGPIGRGYLEMTGYAGTFRA